MANVESIFPQIIESLYVEALVLSDELRWALDRHPLGADVNGR